MSRGDRVGCYLSNSPSWVVASLAVWLAGGDRCAVGTLVPSSGGVARCSTMAGARTVVALSDAPELDAGFDVVRVEEGGLLQAAEPTPAVPDPSELPLPDSNDLAVAIFTSGTTGHPKGITHTHGDLVAAARRVAGGLRPRQRVPPRSRTRAPRARRALQPVRAHGRLQPPRVPDVDRPSDGDRAEVHRRRHEGAARALSTWTRCSSRRR